MPRAEVIGTKLVVRDAKMLADFYEAALGLSPMFRLEHGEGNDAFVEISLTAAEGDNPHRLILVQYLERSPPPPGEALMLFATPDLDAAISTILSLGGRMTMPAKTIPEHRLRLAFATDPEGHAIELLEFGSD